MDKAKILLQLDTDAYASVFDRVVAVDSGVDHIFSYGSVTPERVVPLVHGAIFTRGSKDLHRTAIFIGGSDITAGEAVLETVKKTILPQFGLSVSLFLDSNGGNTTAAAAVWCASKHLKLSETTSLILGGTGPVGLRVARLLAKEGGKVRIGSRSVERAEAAAAVVRKAYPGSRVEGCSVASSDTYATNGCQLVFATGAAGALLLPKKMRSQMKDLRVAIDLNAVPPSGIEGVELNDKAKERDGIICYGAIGVGDTKMKLQKAAISRLFENKSLVIDAEEVYDIAKSLS